MEEGGQALVGAQQAELEGEGEAAEGAQDEAQPMEDAAQDAIELACEVQRRMGRMIVGLRGWDATHNRCDILFRGSVQMV